MRRFLRDVLLFVLFCAAINLVNFLPTELFTFRNWEALTYQRRLGFFSYGAFYRDQSTRRSEYGDLAHHSSLALRKEEIIWRTDRLGNRNDEFVQTPDIVLVGDSDLTGSGVSQENTLVNLINQDGRYRAYSIAPKGMDELMTMMTYGVIDTPTVVVYQRIERETLSIPPIRSAGASLGGRELSRIRTNTAAAVAFEAMDKIHAQRPFRYLQARLRGTNGLANSIQSSVDSSFFFLRYAAIHAVNYASSDGDLNHVAEALVRYRDFLASRNIEFVFLPVPNKATIYHDLVPLDSQPVFLARLIQRLKADSIRVVDTFEMFTRAAKRELLYFQDDTHWNERAISLTHSELQRQLEDLRSSSTVREEP